MKNKLCSIFSILFLLFITDQLTAQKKLSTSPTLFITNIQLIDGTGKPAYSASVRIQGNKILQVDRKSTRLNSSH